jgi:hypothetical protein
MRKSQRRLLLILLSAMIALVIIAVAAGVAFVVLRQPRAGAGTWQDPSAAVVSAQVAPDLALYPLAGASEVEAIDAAIDTGELMTAYSMLMHSSNVSDRQRIGRLSVLGDRLIDSEQPGLAAVTYQQIYDLALLSPRLNDWLRGEALRAAGQGWAKLDQKDRAAGAFEQAHLLAARSPYLQTAQRRELLVKVLEAYRGLDQPKQAQEIEAQIRELDESSSEKPVAVSMPRPELPLGENPVSSPEVGALEETRRQAAFALIGALAEGQEPARSLADGLREALVAEDVGKLALYDQELAGTSQSARRIDIQWQKIRWLLLKYEIASGAVGRSVVPEWEAQLPAIQSSLSKAYEGLLFDYEDLMTALPEASLIGPGRYEARRLIALAGRLGQYPNFPAEQMAEKLQAAAEDLIGGGWSNALLVDVVKEDDSLDFVFSPAGAYGQPVPTP